MVVEKISDCEDRKKTDTTNFGRPYNDHTTRLETYCPLAVRGHLYCSIKLLNAQCTF
jgi:hypothetical protein